MILGDINVLICAFYEHADQHDVFAGWLNNSRSEGEEFLLPDSVLLGFLRIVTSPQIYQDPAPMSEALAFTSVLRRGRRARVVEDLGSVWSAFDRLVADDRQIKGNLVPGRLHRRRRDQPSGAGRYPRSWILPLSRAEVVRPGGNEQLTRTSR